MGSMHGQLQNVWAAAASVAGGAGAAIMFVAARRDDGVSEIARAFAELAAARAARSAWLLDLNFFTGGQFEAMGGEASGLQGPFDMTFGRAPFWRAVPRAPDGSQGEGALVSYRTSDPKLFVSRFRREALSPGQKLQVAPAPEYWRALRNSVDMTIVEAPPLESSRAGLAIAPDMDGIILVIDVEKGDARDAIEMRDEILSRGGRCLGIVGTVRAKETRRKRGGLS
jgi:hypothetical protein